jgi:4-amino-4-deoxy-L-arabinose transferase-like glycosyltransferase
MQRRYGRLVGALAGLSAALALGGWLRWTPPGAVQDLRPRYDALEYEEVGRNLSRGEGFTIVTGGQKYAPAHAPGFPALLAAYFLFSDEGPGAGIRVVFACALVTIAATWAMGWLAAGPWCGAAAGLLMALAPLHVRWSRAVMSDVPSAAAIACIGAWTLAALGRRSDGKTWCLIGACVGLAGAIRQTNLLVGMPIALLVALEAQGTTQRLRWLGALALGGMVGLMPTFAYNAMLFGSPLRDGLSVWVPGTHFGWNLTRFHPGGVGGDPNGIFYARMVAGGGSLYPVPTAILLVMGIVTGLRGGAAERRLVLLALGLMAGFLAAHLAFFAQWDRYFVPVIPLLAALAALPLQRPSVRSLAVPALALVVLSGVQIASPRLYDPPDRPLGEVAVLRDLATRLEPNAALFARANAILFERLLRRDGDRVLVSLGRDDVRDAIALAHVQPLGPKGDPAPWMHEVMPEPFDAAQIERLIRDLRAQGRPVYLTTMVAFQVPSMARLVTLFKQLGAEYVPSKNSSALLRLGPGPQAPLADADGSAR